MGVAVPRTFVVALTGFLGFVTLFTKGSTEAPVLERNLGATVPIGLMGACARLGDWILALAAIAAVLRATTSAAGRTLTVIRLNIPLLKFKFCSVCARRLAFV